MADPLTKPDHEVTLDLLSAVEANDQHSQRSLARDLGIALGLTNAYVKRCMKRGWIKAIQAPPNRYAYYLTPKGFSEKSRLTARYLKSSFSFYRRARNELDDLFELAEKSGLKRVALAGRSELAEIALLCAGQYPVEIAAVVDTANEPSFLGVPVVSDLSAVSAIDGIIVTDTRTGQETYDAIIARNDQVPVYAPKMLRVQTQTQGKGTAQ